jgi:CRISPR-associated protein Csd2
MTAINNRFEFVYLFDVENGNPNGDPDAGNTPRIDPETGHGLVTDVCLKRKVRNYVDIVKQGGEGYNIYVAEKGVLSTSREPAYKTEEVKKHKKKGEQVAAARKWMCENFFDVRTFGAVMSTTLNNCGQVRGPVQLTFAKSVDPIVPAEVSITRMAVETEKEAEAQSGDNRTMGRKHIVPYGLYRAEGFVSAHLAQGDKGTGFSDDDLELFWQALAGMFDHDHSAARGKMSARGLYVFKHKDALGNAPAHKLFEAVTVARKEGEGPARSFGDYEVSVDESAIPDSVTLEAKF